MLSNIRRTELNWPKLWALNGVFRVNLLRQKSSESSSFFLKSTNLGAYVFDLFLSLIQMMPYFWSKIQKSNSIIFLGYVDFWPKISLILKTFLGNLTTHNAIMATTKSWELSYTVTEASFRLFVCLCAALLKPARVLLALGGT